jgi:hypothetical protein
MDSRTFVYSFKSNVPGFLFSPGLSSPVLNWGLVLVCLSLLGRDLGVYRTRTGSLSHDRNSGILETEYKYN